jgi:hypothetical protein
MRFVVDKVTQGEVVLPAFLFPLSVSFNRYSILIFIYTLLLPERQMVKAREPYKNNEISEIRQHCVEKYFNVSVNLYNSSPHITTHRSQGYPP